MTGPRVLFLAIPSYDGRRANASALVAAVTQRAEANGFQAVMPREARGSLLAHNRNILWVEALHARADGVTHFLTLDDDVVPRSPRWADDMLAVMERVNAPVLSTIVPIKDKRGLTSTAVDDGDTWGARRITITEAYQLPPTFTDAELVVSTGMMLVDFRDPWVERVHFTITDRILADGAGQFRAVVEPEDWNFSRQVRALGKKVWATREVLVDHVGAHSFHNAEPWGTCPIDHSAAPALTSATLTLPIA